MDLHSDDSIPNFQSVKKFVSIKIHTIFLGTTFLLASQKLTYFKIEGLRFTSPFSLQLFHKLQPTYTIGPLRNYDSQKQNYLYTPQKFIDRPLILPGEHLIATDSSHSDCIPTTVSQRYVHLSIVFSPPLNNKELKTNIDFASQHHSYTELHFLLAQSTDFISKKQ